jgi:protein-L-isoaspartate(D-aspartate) O-methyltransferase
MMIQKNSANRRASHVLLLLFIVFVFLLISRPVNNYDESPTVSLQNTTTSTLESADSNDPNRPQHKQPAYKDRIEERRQMVASQLRVRDINDPNVLRAMQTVPRHAFVRKSEENVSYSDSALPIEYEQTISQPYVVAFMTQVLNLKPDYKVLEIGTGSGYQAAICAEIAKEVYTIEIVEGLAKIAQARLEELGYKNVFVKFGDGYYGWKEHAPYDAIISTAAAGRVPQPLIDQLKPGGRMIIPIGSASGYQELEIITKDKDGNIKKESVLVVRFVPMTGEIQKPAPKTVK